MLIMGLCMLIGHQVTTWMELEAWDESISEWEAARSQLMAVQAQGLFPPSMRQRAEKASPEYLHDVVESLPLLRTAENQLQQLSETPAFKDVRSLQEAVEQLRSHPNRLHFVSKPSAPGKVFRDRQYSLMHPCEVDLKDVGRLLVLMEGAPSQEPVTSAARPLLWIQDLRLERKEQPAGHYLLELGVIEREWKGRKSSS